MHRHVTHSFGKESCSTVQTGPPSTGASHIQPPGQIQRPAHAKEYSFLDIELRYGLLQVYEHTHIKFTSNIERVMNDAILNSHNLF